MNLSFQTLEDDPIPYKQYGTVVHNQYTVYLVAHCTKQLIFRCVFDCFQDDALYDLQFALEFDYKLAYMLSYNLDTNCDLVPFLRQI